MTKLSVNVNKVATLRNTRELELPSVVEAAITCIKAGAQGITVHPRPDQRHIRPGDVLAISKMLREFPDVEYNIEGNPFHGFMDLVREFKPHQVTLVPDSPDVFTSNSGWDVAARASDLQPVINELKSLGCRVSLFMNADVAAIKACKQLKGIDRVELYTEPYAVTFSGAPDAATLKLYIDAAQAAIDIGLGVNAGHDLNLDNLGPFLAAVPGVSEVSIGHALIADALFMGLETTVKKYRSLCSHKD